MVDVKPQAQIDSNPPVKNFNFISTVHPEALYHEQKWLKKSLLCKLGIHKPKPQTYTRVIALMYVYYEICARCDRVREVGYEYHNH